VASCDEGTREKTRGCVDGRRRSFRGLLCGSSSRHHLGEANAITGSIGVFGLFANIEELADRTGIRTHRSDRGAVTGPSTFEPLTAPQRAALQRSVDAAYTRFLQAVIVGRGQARGLDEASLRAVAEGRVWNGTQARERKLVDELGGLADAVADARRRAGISEDESVTLEVVVASTA
jgi:protease-4